MIQSKSVPGLALFVVFSSIACAAVIPVANPSFEILPAGGLNTTCGAGCSFDAGPIPDWTDSGFSGQFQPGSLPVFNSLPDGPTIAYSNGGVISQTVGATVIPGVTYTLQVDIGLRKDSAFTGSAELEVNGLPYAAIGLAPSPGDWSTYTATYTGLPIDAGDSITIDLLSSGSQGDFDNVRLSDNLTPEPSTLAAIGVVLLALGWRRHRSRR